VTKDQISNLLGELKSEEAYVRNDAIKKIIKGKIDDENIIHALMWVIENNPNQAVRNFARAALDLFGIEHSAVEIDSHVLRTTEVNNLETLAPIQSFSSSRTWRASMNKGFSFIKTSLIGIVTGFAGGVVAIWYISSYFFPESGSGNPILTAIDISAVTFCLSPFGLFAGLIGGLFGNITGKTKLSLWFTAILGFCFGFAGGILVFIGFIFS